MVLTDGTYVLRYIPQGAGPDLVGGLYASSKDGLDKPVTAEGLGPKQKIYVGVAFHVARIIAKGIVVEYQES